MATNESVTAAFVSYAQYLAPKPSHGIEFALASIIFVSTRRKVQCASSFGLKATDSFELHSGHTDEHRQFTGKLCSKGRLREYHTLSRFCRSHEWFNLIYKDTSPIFIIHTNLVWWLHTTVCGYHLDLSIHKWDSSSIYMLLKFLSILMRGEMFIKACFPHNTAKGRQVMKQYKL